MQTVTLNVEGMSCDHCVRAVVGALQDIKTSGRVDLKTGTVKVQFDENTMNLAAIREAIEEQGYEVK